MAYSVALIEQGTCSGRLGVDKQSENAPVGDTLMPTKWARVRVTTDTTSYTTGGLALNILAALTGWTGIARWYSNRVMWSTTMYYGEPVVPNHGTTGSRLIKIKNASTDAEAPAAGSTASVFDMWLSGW